MFVDCGFLCFGVRLFLFRYVCWCFLCFLCFISCYVCLSCCCFDCGCTLFVSFALTLLMICVFINLSMKACSWYFEFLLGFDCFMWLLFDSFACLVGCYNAIHFDLIELLRLCVLSWFTGHTTYLWVFRFVVFIVLLLSLQGLCLV